MKNEEEKTDNQQGNEVLPCVSGSTLSVSELIIALNETLLANKAVGTYKHIENLCIKKLEILINSIEV